MKQWEESNSELSEDSSLGLHRDGTITLEIVVDAAHEDGPDVAMVVLTNSEAYALLEHLARFFHLRLLT